MQTLGQNQCPQDAIDSKMDRVAPIKRKVFFAGDISKNERMANKLDDKASD
jgi:hypothetical protein